MLGRIPELVKAEAADRVQNPVIGLPSGSLFIGEVIDNVAHLGVVHVGGTLKGVMQGIPISNIGNGIIGARNIGAAYPIHSKVLCYQPANSHFCFVINGIPEVAHSPKFNLQPDWIVPGCNSGYFFDRVHQMMTESKGGKNVLPAFTHGRPCDELPGDHGVINELGVSYGIGKMMAWLRASHFCGVEAFWADNLLRLTGYNMEIDTAGREDRYVDDEGEYNETYKWSCYPWETRGVVRSSSDFTKETFSNSTDTDKAAREPVRDDQDGLWRVKEFKGYLGNLNRTFVGLVNDDTITGAVNTYGAAKQPGVLDVGYDSRGGYFVRAAKEIVLEKSVGIRLPVERKLPDDPTGDNDQNYKAAGTFGSGDTHDVTEYEINEPGSTAMLAWEMHAAMYSVYRNMPFIRHTRDWFIPSEYSNMHTLKLDKARYEPEKKFDPTSFWMPMPKHSSIKVDHRQQEVKYYCGRSCIKMSDNGSILIEDAFGSQIRMENGNIILAARLDVIMQPGRSGHIWAPNDIVLKAGSSMDLSASTGDVRIKAQGNLMAVAVERGVLIESQSTNDTKPDWSNVGEQVQSRGVLIAAKDSNIVTLSKNAYLRSGVKEGTEINSEFHIDAGGGGGDLFLHGGDAVHRCSRSFQVITGSSGNNDENTASLDFRPNEFVLGGKSLNYATIGASVIAFGHEDFNTAVEVLGDLYVDGSVLATKNGIFDESVLAGGSLVVQHNMQTGGSAIFAGSIICRAIASDDNNGFIGKTADDFRAKDQTPPAQPPQGKDQLDSDKVRVKSTLQSQRLEDNSIVTDIIFSLYGDGSQYASTDIVKNASFSFRVPTEYGTNKDFVWYESRWQETNKAYDLSTAVWEETDIRKTMPYPGYDTWVNASSMTIVEQQNYDHVTGTAFDTTVTRPAKTKFVNMKDGYNVTLQRKVNK